MLLVCLCLGLAAAQEEEEEDVPPEVVYKGNKGYEGLKAYLARDLDVEMFRKNGKSSASGFIYRKNGDQPADSACYSLGTMAYQDAKGNLPTRDNVCTTPLAPEREGFTPTCAYTSLNVKARFRRTMIEHKHCAAESEKAIQTKQKTTKVTANVQVKATASLMFEIGFYKSKVGGSASLELTAGASIEDSIQYTKSQETTMSRGQTLYLIGVSIQIITTVDKMALTGKAAGGCTTTNKFFTTTPYISTGFLVGEGRSKAQWLELELKGGAATNQAAPKPATPSGSLNKRTLPDPEDPEDVCEYIDDNGDFVVEPCTD
ncbi:hypothetical protein BG015_000820 [Linnemannia schmuckeri]|uniref:Uncharacterized protein n=1 Tax=Linnemannia schmuckeri TaxID=64567 RepID=A0A9P5V7D2_9FUNG|nr:hypothetical protein BG015_000820 [Linnemannia schmuckeri]